MKHTIQFYHFNLSKYKLKSIIQDPTIFLEIPKARVIGIKLFRLPKNSYDFVWFLYLLLVDINKYLFNFWPQNSRSYIDRY